MENEKNGESIFEQEDYQGGLGSGPLAVAPEEDTETDLSDEDDDSYGDTAGTDTADS